MCQLRHGRCEYNVHSIIMIISDMKYIIARLYVWNIIVIYTNCLNLSCGGIVCIHPDILVTDTLHSGYHLISLLNHINRKKTHSVLPIIVKLFSLGGWFSLGSMIYLV